MMGKSDLNDLLGQIISLSGGGANCSIQGGPVSKTGTPGHAGIKKSPLLKPENLLVILGILGGVLQVNSVLVDRDQVLQVSLTGSLRRRTKLDEMLDEIGHMPFDEVLRSLMRRT